VLYDMLDYHTQSCLGLLEVLEDEDPDLIIFFDEDESKIIDTSDNLITVQYRLEEDLVTTQIPFSKIENTAETIAECLKDELNMRRN